MELFLLRHGDAEAGLPDSARQLTAVGRKKIINSANGYRQHCGEIDLVLTSPLQRALQSTELFMANAALGCNYQVVDFLLPNTSIDEVERQFQAFDLNRLLMVGHLPLLEHWIDYLTGDASATMATASLASLTMDYAYKGMATLNWIHHVD